MEKKKVTKISLSTFFLILAIIVIIVMGIFIYKLYNEKTIEIENSKELQEQVNILNRTTNNLQGKIDSISDTINSNTSTKNEYTIEFKFNSGLGTTETYKLTVNYNEGNVIYKSFEK